MEIKFAKPISFEGQQFDSIVLDLDALTGKDVNDVSKVLKASGWYSAVPAADPEFCMYMAQRASDQPLEFFEQLPAGAYSKVVQQVTNFLLAAD